MDIESTMEANKGGFFVHWKNCLETLSSIKSIFISFTKSIIKFGKNNPRRVNYSLKFAFAFTLVFLIYYLRSLCNGFGIIGMWSILTVVVVFEFSVGAIFCKSLNKVCATLLGGALGVGVQHLITIYKEREDPIFIILLYLNIVWAGEDLHKLVASNIEKLANYLQGFEVKYFHCSEDKEKCENSVLEGYKTVLHSKESEESLENFARWEPGHDRFLFRHPWKQYLKIGVLTRECALNIKTLDNYLNPEISTSLEFQCKIQELCTKMISESNKALNMISSSIKTMTHPSATKTHIKNAKSAVEELKFVLKIVFLEAGLLSVTPVTPVTLIFEEIIKSVEKIYESVSELSNLAYFKNVAESNMLPEKPYLLHRDIIKPVVDIENTVDHVAISDNHRFDRKDNNKTL
ncbi:hypothetical protein V8G54_018733 [Vigna mungo]|uniref:Aluminum-activated malate transporter n=1 Tax=Vigna mungo TaxID=3915 RepID=A0AAQ3RSY8_VIGMU